MKKSILMLALFSVIGTSAFAQNRIYRYVGANGNIMYSDNVPANEKGKIEILSSSTMALKDTQDKELNEEEVEAKGAIEEEQKVAKKNSEIERQKNQSLLNQYNSINDIDKLKEYELQQISRNLASNKDVLNSLQKNKEQILNEIAKNKGKAPGKLEKEIIDIDNNIIGVEKAIESNQNLKDSRSNKYDEDKKKYLLILEEMGKNR